MSKVTKPNASAVKTNVDTRVWKHYFDNYKRAREFAKANDSKCVRVDESSSRVYLVLTLGEGVR